MGLAGAAIGAGGRLISNALEHRPLLQNVGRDMLLGGAIGLSMGLVAPALTAGGTTAATTGGVLEPTAGQVRLVAQQLESSGRVAVESSVRSWTERLAEHVGKAAEIRERGGNAGSVEREIRNFRGLIEAGKRALDQ